MIPEEVKLKMIRFAGKAPSGHNTQPWKFKMGKESITILPDFSRRLPVVDSDDHALFISLGCALENLLIAAQQMGYDAESSVQKSTESFIIKMNLKKSEKPKANSLFPWIDKRQVTRSPFASVPLDEKDILQLADICRDDLVNVKWFYGKDEISKLEPYIIEGSNKQFENKAFVRELASWIRFNEKQALTSGDGIYGASLNFPTVPAAIGKFIMTRLVGAKSEANRWKKLIYNSAGFAMFCVQTNNVENQIRLGQIYQRFSLEATALNIKHAHANMPCEEISVREKLINDFNLQNNIPLLLIRFGIAGNMPFSFRRNLNEVIIKIAE